MGIVQNNPSLSQGMAQISDSRSILKPNRVIPSMFLTPQPCAYILTHLKAPITACRRFDSQSLSSGEGSFGYSATGILEILQGASQSRNPLVSRCHRHNTLRSRSTHCSLTDSADGGLCIWRCLRLNRPQHPGRLTCDTPLGLMIMGVDPIAPRAFVKEEAQVCFCRTLYQTREPSIHCTRDPFPLPPLPFPFPPG